MIRLKGWSYLESVYFSIISLTKVGFGDFVPHTQPADKWAMWVFNRNCMAHESCDNMTFLDISTTKLDVSVPWSVHHHELALVSSSDSLMLVQVRARRTSMSSSAFGGPFCEPEKRVHGHQKWNDALSCIAFWFSFGFYLESLLHVRLFISCVDL